MTKLKISKYFDILTTSLTLFLLFFCWIKFYTKNPLLSGIFAVFLMGIGVFLIFFANFKHEKKKTLSKNAIKQAIDCALQLQFSSKQNVENFFEQTLKNNYKVTKHNFGFVLEKDHKKIFFVANFWLEKLDLYHFSQIYVAAKSLNLNEIFVCSNDFDEATKTFAKGIKNLKITFFDKFLTYSTFIEPFKILPEKVVDTTPEKLKLREILKLTISRERTKHYFLSGLILFLCSFFVPYKFYYLVFGSIGFLLALTTLIFANKSPKRLNLTKKE